MSYPCKINKLLQKFLEENLTGSYYFCFCPAYSFKITPEALKILVFPTPSNNPHQPFVEKLTDYQRVIGRKLQSYIRKVS